jgi:hypothetical protein
MSDPDHTAAPPRSVRPWRKPLQVAFVLGCFVSAVASGRFTVRLIADGALSFAFVPAFDLLALGAVFASARRERRFAPVVDAYFGGYTAWLLWLVAASALFMAVPPRASLILVKPALASALVPFLWSQRADFRCFRDHLRGGGRGALRDFVIQRALQWSASVVWFIGIAVWNETVPQIHAQIHSWVSR